MDLVELSAQQLTTLKVAEGRSSSYTAQPSYSHVDPPLQMTSIKLDGTNYPPWKMAVYTYLLGSRKISFPERSPLIRIDSIYDQWCEDDAMSSKEIWEHVATMYSGADNLTRICDRFSDWFRLERGDKPVGSHYSDYLALCQELDLLLPFTVDSEVLKKRQDEMRVVRFLDSLGPDYLQIRQQLVSSGSLPTLAEAFSRVQRMRVPQSGEPLVDGSAHVSYGGGDRGRGGGRFGRGRDGGWHGRGRSRGGGRESRGGRDGGGRGRGGRHCTHCRLDGHTVDYCYNLHPELRPYRSGNASAAASDGISSFVAPFTSESLVLPRAEYEELLRLRDKGKELVATFAH
ncbi:uncharacterized protein LOC143854747 [Tasmannia lanceolata]|uniref:uncharacterized protein LOC143854747 n=1 Tax=Tasmannia lanceolata TaxID=3420 RepID=UPI004062F886